MYHFVLNCGWNELIITTTYVGVKYTWIHPGDTSDSERWVQNMWNVPIWLVSALLEFSENENFGEQIYFIV